MARPNAMMAETTPSILSVDRPLFGFGNPAGDRKLRGLILEMAVRENISLAALQKEQSRGFLNRKHEVQLSKDMINRLGIKTPGDQQQARLLSGGNQQKLVIAKWLALNPLVLLMDEPTRGIDVGAKGEIYSLMEELAESGVSILFVSSEMEEIVSISDRVIVMHEGHISGELMRGELSEEAVMQLATGSSQKAAA